MRIYENGKYRDMTEHELAEMQEQQEQAEREYWDNVSYDDAVNAEIRKRYTESQEFSIPVFLHRDSKNNAPRGLFRPRPGNRIYGMPCQGCRCRTRRAPEWHLLPVSRKMPPGGRQGECCPLSCSRPHNRYLFLEQGGILKRAYQVVIRSSSKRSESLREIL